MPGANRHAKRTKYWCFTINNFVPSDVIGLRNLVKEEKADYVIFGREVGQSGTRHLQGYLEFKSRKSLNQVRKIVSRKGHYEARRGSKEEAADYCRKEEDYEEFGEAAESNRGARNDLEAIKARIDDGASDYEIAEEYFSRWCVYRRSFQAYRALKFPPRLRVDLRVYVLWGDPGTGKTRLAHYLAGGKIWTSCSPDLQWFDGYRGESVVLLDDYRGDGSAAFLLRLLDIYALQVPVKGGFVAWNPTTIFITSNMRPSEWHPDITDALRRRLHDVIHFRS